MAKNNAVVAICKSRIEAEAAVKELQHCGFDMKNLSIVGRDNHTDENAIGCFAQGNGMKYWSKTGAFCGGLWGVLKNSIAQPDTALKTDKFAVIAHGSAEEASRAHEIISHTTPESVEEHQSSRINPEPRPARA
jgi:hypothetical protein